LDSATTLAVAAKEADEVYTLTVNYGQRHSRESESARRLSEHFGAREHKVVSVDLGSLGGSALTEEGIEIPVDRSEEEIGEGIPVTYVPARNTVLMGVALAYAETLDADAVYIGANAIDYSGYPDCRPQFYRAFAEVARVGTRRGVEGRPVEIRHPLIDLTKAEIVRMGAALGVPFEFTWSCYFGREGACGRCDSCLLRLKGFREAGLEDPLEYEVGA
jgi:7-cyano-7-deazaguanine synthase